MDICNAVISNISFHINKIIHSFNHFILIQNGCISSFFDMLWKYYTFDDIFTFNFNWLKWFCCCLFEVYINFRHCWTSVFWLRRMTSYLMYLNTRICKQNIQQQRWALKTQKCLHVINEDFVCSFHRHSRFQNKPFLNILIKCNNIFMTMKCKHEIN